jgi:hypothetical protein
MEPLYTVTWVGKEPLEGITDPLPCTLRGIAKFDSPESPFCVYNEYVALRVGRFLNVPLADGVLSLIDNDISYVSLQLSPDKQLLQPLASQYPKIARRYPLEAAALLAFDLLIGNWDRYSNFMATLVHQPMIRAFDHSHALLTITGDPMTSMKHLASNKLIAKSHPFMGLVDYTTLSQWVNRLEGLDRTHLWRCCSMMGPFKDVTLEMQDMLIEALYTRRKKLPGIIAANREYLCNEQ